MGLGLRQYVRWRKLLQSCQLDPDLIERPVPEPGPRDFLIVGCPRSGSSLVSALLFQPPWVAVCMEPWDGLRMPPAELFHSLRHEIAETGRLSRGRLDTRALNRGEIGWTRDGASPTPLDLAPTYHLGVKWPGFWRYLPLLPNTRTLVCLRDPVEILQSFERIGGRLGKGLEYDVAFHATMNRELRRATDNIAVRRALLYEYIHAAIVPHLDESNVFVIRYERWRLDPERLLAEIGEFLELKGTLELRVPITTPGPSAPRPDLDALTRIHCPSAAALGYTRT